MYGIFKPKSKGKSGLQLELGGIAILTGCIMDQPLKYTIPFQISKSDTGEMEGDSTIPIIHQLAAKTLIQDWQNEEGLHGLSADKTKKAIIDLSIEASVVSTHTAYVAVDEEQDKPITGAIKMWDITAAMAKQEGRHGFRRGRSVRARADGMETERRSRLRERLRLRERSRSRSRERDNQYVQCRYAQWRGSEDARDVVLPAELKPHTTSDKHTSLISLQQAEGNWQFDSSLAGVLTKPLEKLESSCPVPCKGGIRAVWATILALVFLETVCASQRDEWELVAFKAEAWLQGQPLPSGVDMNTLKEAARKISAVA